MEETKDYSLWRKKGSYYFGDNQDKFCKLIDLGVKQTVKIAVDMNYPLSFYVNSEGRCSLFSLYDDFRELGNTNLPASSNAQDSSIGKPNSIAHCNNWLLVATNEGVSQFEINSTDVVRKQNIDDFVQMALPRQEQPTNATPVASFYSSDVQISSWPNVVHSVIEASKMKKDDLSDVKRQVDAELAKNKTNFEATFVGFYNHQTENPPQTMPLSGPANNGVRQIAFTFRSPNSFQSIKGCQWFDWDIPKQKLKISGSGDGFQLLSVDASALLRETIAIGTHGGNVLLHDLRSKESIQQMKFNEPRPISNVKFSPIIQSLLATSTDDFKIKLWDIRSRFDKPFLVLEGHTHEISGIQFSNHRADFLYTSSYDSTVRVWNINDQIPPHNCMMTVTPSPGSPVLDIVSGCHRPDSFYYSCADGSTGICVLQKKIFKNVIPYKLTEPEDRKAEKLQYYRNNQQLLAQILPKVSRILTERSNVEPIFPLLDLTVSRQFDLSNTGLASTPIKEVIDFFSYYPSSAIPQQFMQAPEPAQLADALRYKLFGKVIGSIQKNDADTLMYEKRNILTTLEAFSRDDILSIVKVLASSSFDEALEVGSNYLELLIRNKKLDKFLDIGYFLMFPTIYDDPTKEFQVLAKVEHNVRTQLRTILNNGSKILGEIRDYQAILATASNDKDTSARRIFDTLKKHDRFLSMFLCRTFLSITLSLAQWSQCIIAASQAAKDTVGFPFHDILFNWLENDVRERFSIAIVGTLQSKNTDPASYINAISEVILIASQSQELPKPFEETLDQLTILIHDILQNLLKDDSSVKISKASPVTLALAIKNSIDSHGKSMAQQGNRTRNVNSLMTLITNVISTAPSQ